MKFQIILAFVCVAGWLVEPSKSLGAWKKHKKHPKLLHIPKLDTNEQPPNEIVNELVSEHRGGIMTRSNAEEISGDAWKDDSIVVEALGFFMVKHGDNDNYYIRVIIDGTHISHVKIYFVHATWKGRTWDSGDGHLRLKGKGTDSTLATVIGNKKETDKLSQAELDGSRK